MSDTDRTILLCRKESSFGAGAAGAKLTKLGFTSHGFRFQQTRTEDNDIDEDRSVGSHTLEDQDASGSITADFRRGWSDDIAEGLMQGDWSSETTVIAANTGVSYTHGTLRFSLASGSWAATPTVGSWIRVSGFAGAKAVLNGFYEVATGTDTNDIVVAKGTGTAVGDHTAGDSVSIVQLARVLNGTSDESYVFEEQVADIASEFEAFTHMVANTLALRSQRGQGGGGSRVVIDVGFVGGSSTKETVTTGDGSPTAKTSNRPYTAAGGEGGFFCFENDTKFKVVEIGLNITNGREANKNLGDLPPESAGSGKFRSTVNWRAYAKALHQSFETAARAGTRRDLAYVFTDAEGNCDIFHAPQVVYEAPEKPVPGKEQRRFFSAKGMVEKETTLGFAMQWCRYNAP